MADWMTVFRAIPWLEVIESAPAIARGARSLWTGIRKPPRSGAPGEARLDPEERLELLEARMVELKKDLAASSEVITALAAQNERLVEAVSILRARVRVLIVGCAALAVLGIALAVWLSSLFDRLPGMP